MHVGWQAQGGAGEGHVQREAGRVLQAGAQGVLSILMEIRVREHHDLLIYFKNLLSSVTPKPRMDKTLGEPQTSWFAKCVARE